MKKIVLILSTVVLMLGLSGCCVNHTWIEATCEMPKTCSVCGKERGKELGHTWIEATCEDAKTCSICGKTEGEKLGHTWIEATCEEAKTCSVCGKVEGRKRGHDWTEVCGEPKLCNKCGKIETEKLEHDWTEASCVEPKMCSRCGQTEGVAWGHRFDENGLCTICGMENAIEITVENYREYFDLELTEKIHNPGRGPYDTSLMESYNDFVGFAVRPKYKMRVSSFNLEGQLRATCLEGKYRDNEFIPISFEDNSNRVFGTDILTSIDGIYEEVLYDTYFIGGFTGIPEYDKPMPNIEDVPKASYVFEIWSISGKITIISEIE